MYSKMFSVIYVYVSTFDTIWTYVGIIGVGGIYGQDETGMLLLGVRVYNKDVFSKISETNPNRPSTSFRMFFPLISLVFRHLQVTKWRKIRRHFDFSFGKLAISTKFAARFLSSRVNTLL